MPSRGVVPYQSSRQRGIIHHACQQLTGQCDLCSRGLSQLNSHLLTVERTPNLGSRTCYTTYTTSSHNACSWDHQLHAKVSLLRSCHCSCRMYQSQRSFSKTTKPTTDTSSPWCDGESSVPFICHAQLPAPVVVVTDDLTLPTYLPRMNIQKIHRVTKILRNITKQNTNGQNRQDPGLVWGLRAR